MPLIRHEVGAEIMPRDILHLKCRDADPFAELFSGGLVGLKTRAPLTQQANTQTGIWHTQHARSTTAENAKE